MQRRKSVQALPSNNEPSSGSVQHVTGKTRAELSRESDPRLGNTFPGTLSSPPADDLTAPRDKKRDCVRPGGAGARK